ncbi:MAG: DUF4159 domain-containing protein [Acidobacteria bacterium]|nr:DUF4159 domain-containing protein [Acidobacteriota bacterium]
MTRSAALVMAGLLAGLLLVAPARLSQALAQAPTLRDERFAGLQWTFVRVRYSARTEDSRYRLEYWGEPWAIDAPAAEQNLSRRLRTATAIEVKDPIVLALDDPKLWEQGWLYVVEPGNMQLRDEEVGNLREFLLRGGTVTFDDFHGPYEWDNFASEMRRVFPDRQIVDLEPPHPIFSSFYSITAYPQTPGLGSFFAGRTWEKGGFIARLRGILDDRGRPMVLANWNTDMGDGVEWSNAEEYPGYIKYTAEAYRMFINEIIYSLTH